MSKVVIQNLGFDDFKGVIYINLCISPKVFQFDGKAIDQFLILTNMCLAMRN